MDNISTIHSDKTPKRIHFIVEWAEKFNMKQAYIVREIEVDKGLVSRWFGGTLPKQEYLEKLAALFEMEGDISRIFRHPDDDWLLKLLKPTDEGDEKIVDLLKAKPEAEQARAVRMMKASLRD